MNDTTISSNSNGTSSWLDGSMDENYIQSCAQLVAVEAIATTGSSNDDDNNNPLNERMSSSANSNNKLSSSPLFTGRWSWSWNTNGKNNTNKDNFTTTTTNSSSNYNQGQYEQQENGWNNTTSNRNDSNSNSNGILNNTNENWDTMEQQLHYRQQIVIYNTIKYRFIPWKIKVCKFIIYSIFLVIDCIISLVLFFYSLTLSIVTYYNHTHAHTHYKITNESSNESIRFSKQIIHIIIGLWILTIWYSTRYLFLSYGIRSISSTSTRCCTMNSYINTPRILVWITSYIQSPITITLYTIVAILYTIIRLSFPSFDNTTSSTFVYVHWITVLTKLSPLYIGQYIIKHSHSLCIPSVIVQYIIQPIVQTSKTVGPYTFCSYIWLFVLFLILIEVLRIKLLSFYRSFLLFCDTQIENNNNNEYNNIRSTSIGQPWGQRRQQQQQQQNTINYMDVSTWENLQEPLMNTLPGTSCNNNNNNYNNNTTINDNDGIRFGIPRWVHQSNINNNNDNDNNNDVLFTSTTGDGSSDEVSFITSSLGTHNNNQHGNIVDYQQSSRSRRRRRKKKHKRTIMSVLFNPFQLLQQNDNDNVDDFGSPNDNNDNDSTNSDPSTVQFATIQEEWASMSEEDPFWWSRDDTTTTTSSTSTTGAGTRTRRLRMLSNTTGTRSRTAPDRDWANTI